MTMILFDGKRLKELRESRGLTQNELALKAGLHLTTIGCYEINRREPKATQLKILADALGVKMEAFFTNHNEEVNAKERNNKKKGGKIV